jgi:spore coat polysaccharide biosynthesis protein SpsF
MNKVAIIQARMDSSRLPGKVLLPLAGKSALQRMIERVRQAKQVDDIVVAIGEDNPNNIKKLCDGMGVDYNVGSEDDILKRVYRTAGYFNADIIVELTGDCPLIDPKQIDICIENFIRMKAEYSSNIYPRTWPDGFDIQVYDYSMLAKLFIINKPEHHIGWNIPRVNRYCSVVNYPSPAEYYWPDLGLTLDEKEDWVLLDIIYDHFESINKLDFTAEECIDFVRGHPDLWSINKHVRRKIPEEG